MTNELIDTIIPESRIRSAALTSHGAIEALHEINPELATLVYAHRADILTPEIMPFIMRFRELQSGEKIALVSAIVRKYEADSTVRQEEVYQAGSTERTRISEDGLTRRADISSGKERYKEDSKTSRESIRASTKRYEADSELEGKKVTEIGLILRGKQDLEGRIYEADAETTRAERQATSLEAVNRMRYDAEVLAVQAHVDGQKYLSDNEVKAVYIEATARRKTLVMIEKIRADVARGISMDLLQEAVRTAEIEFATEIRRAEIQRRVLRDKQRAGIVSQYIKSQTQLINRTMNSRLQIELARSQTERMRLKTEAQKYEQLHRTVRTGIMAVRRAISRGNRVVGLSIGVDKEVIKIEYCAKDKDSED